MCTSFVYRKQNVFIAMNFDNNDMPFKVSTNDPSQFVVLVDSGRGKYTSFGVNSCGVFCNNLIVNSNGKGDYKRASKKVTHTSKLTVDLLSGAISPNELRSYLDSVEVVNSPDLSVHNMIVNAQGEVWIVEPGRGVIYSPANESPYFVMTNFSLCDCGQSGTPKGDGADRYKMASALLNGIENMSVDTAFQVLEAVKQEQGDWKTTFSMVYSQNDHAVYYCLDRRFDSISKYQFEL